MANEKILVVDDDTNICELLRLYLTKEGYQVTVANDGEEGLEKFNQVKPDMVLLDGGSGSNWRASTDMNCCNLMQRWTDSDYPQRTS